MAGAYRHRPEKHQEQLKQLGLTADEGENLVAALQCFAERILAQKYGLVKEGQNEKGSDSSI